ncbi:MAG: glycosyltransferase [Chloroflexia bacterium]|nr:glycosyltransferase [Chloroflexia bacterium]
MPPRRIAFLSEHASPVALLGGVDAGGQNVYVDEVSRGLARLGYEVDVFTRRDSVDAPPTVAWGAGVRIINLDAGPPVVLAKDLLWPLMPAFRDALLRFAAAEGVRYDLLHGNFWMSGWVACEIGERVGAPVVQIFHATGKTKQREQGAADTSPDARIAAELEVVRRADRLIAQCPAEERELVADYAAPPARIAMIPSAVDCHRYRPEDRQEARRRIGLPEAGSVVVYVGRMLPRKDIRNVVRAFGLLKQTLPAAAMPLLLVVGGDTAHPDPIVTPEIGELARLAASLGVGDWVRFTGRRQPDELRWYYAAGDVAVTTPWYEPFGLTPLEAMACGRPVVGSDVGGISFTVADGETGMLVPPRDPAALADRLRRLLANPDLCARMGVAARSRVLETFTWPVVAARTAALYETVLAESNFSNHGAQAGTLLVGAGDMQEERVS